MQQISLIDETFNILNYEHYKTTLQILPDSISFTILDSIRKKHVLLNHYQLDNSENFNDTIMSIFSESEILKSNFEDFRIFVFSKNVTIIPNTFFNLERCNEYLKFNSGEENTNNIFSCDTSFESTLAFSLNLETNNLLSTLNYKTLYHHASSLLKEAQIICLQKEIFSGVLINILSQYVEVAVIKDNKLELFNVFQYQTENDLCYYLVYLFDLFKFDKEKCPIVISGIIKKNDSRIIKVEEFFKKIQYSKTSTQHVYSYRFNEVPQYYFSNLFVIPYEDSKRY